MAKGPVNIIEMHIEKILLGLAGVGLLAMVWLYLVQTPNKIDYSGNEVSPGELDEAIRRNAENLRNRLQTSKPDEVAVPAYSRMLTQVIHEGIFGGEDGTAVAANLPVVAPFGREIPVLRADQEASGEVVLVTPLRPSAPAVRTGRSEVIPVVASIVPDETSPPEDPDDVKPVEMPWVSIASYFNLADQQTEMTNAKYASYRSKVYFSGLDVERQEKLASGVWSDWVPVANSKAQPKLDIPDPVVDEVTGDIANDDEVKNAYDIVKSAQKQIVEPSFYSVEAGDFWEIPELEGFEQEEEEEEKVVVKAVEHESNRPRQYNRPPPTSGGAMQAPRMGAGGDVMGGGGGFRPTGGSGGATRSRAAEEKRKRDEDRKRAREDMKAAKEAWSRKDYSAAQSSAQRVVDNENALGGDKAKAKKLIKAVEGTLAREQKSQGTGGAPTFAGAPTLAGGSNPRMMAGLHGSGPMLTGGSRPMPSRTYGKPEAAMGPLETHPEDENRVVLWFNDDTVESGKTYRYRMRARLWNRYVGKMEALKNPEQAKQSVLVGEWSLPSEPVTVTPSTYFFVTGPTTDDDGARCDVFKWHKGSWLRESFVVKVGDVIGGIKKAETGEYDDDLNEIKEEVDFSTGAVVLDLRYDEPVEVRYSASKDGAFNLRENQSVVMVYLDPADQQVKRRVHQFDKYDPLYSRLKEEF